ncbi:hypothetical protein F4780DRAFT_610944 [Xylariomycetidae sp. FL0641]|nr:hypothetical protein F4780DRAFT_610944 [Xylariomycetidae sp. FL0641]
MDTSFSDDEKRFVLAEMVKVSTIDVHTLVEFIRAHNIEPNWMSMQLPGGRNMNQCLGAVDNMFQVRFPPPNLLNFKRKSLSDLTDHPPKRQAIMAPGETPIAPARVIQPRPPPPSGYQPAVPMGSGPVVTTATATGKKRGRPSKADKEAQAQARAAYTRPTEYAPITPAPIAIQPQREYATSPGYEIAGTPTDQNPRKRPRTTLDSPRQASTSYPLPSPASATGTPRALPEPLEHVERATLSPRDRGSMPLDVRSPQLPSFMRPPAASPQPQPQPHLHPRPQPPAPIQPLPRLSQAYDQYRGPDPIFPDRDRARSMPDQIARDSPASPVTNRS